MDKGWNPLLPLNDGEVPHKIFYQNNRLMDFPFGFSNIISVSIYVLSCIVMLMILTPCITLEITSLDVLLTRSHQLNNVNDVKLQHNALC